MAGGRRADFHVDFLNFLRCRTHVDPVTDSNTVSAKNYHQFSTNMSSCKQLFCNKYLTVTWKFKSEFTSVLSQKGVACAKRKHVEAVMRLTSPCCSFWLLAGSGKWQLCFCPELKNQNFLAVPYPTASASVTSFFVYLRTMKWWGNALSPYAYLNQGPSKYRDPFLLAGRLPKGVLFSIEWCTVISKAEEKQSVSIYPEVWVNFNGWDCGQDIRIPAWWALRGDDLRWLMFHNGPFPLQGFCFYFLPFLIPRFNWCMRTQWPRTYLFCVGFEGQYLSGRIN